MKRYKYVLRCSLMVVTFMAASCKKSFLEVVPKGQNIAVTYADYDNLINGSNFYMLGSSYYGIWHIAKLMEDDVAAEASLYNLTKNGYAESRKAFEWKPDIFPLVDPPGDFGVSMPGFLRGFLVNLYSLNKIVNEVNDATSGTAQQKLALQGEAMTERAFTNFQLINYFGKPYNAATAATDLGFPIITTADVTVRNFQRATVQECYDFIIKDLTTAIPNLNASPKSKTRISKAAAETLLGKVYLYAGKFPEALGMLNSAFNDMASVKPVPVLYDYNQTFAPGGAFLPISNLTGPNSPFINITDITESIWAAFTNGGIYNGNAYSVSFLTIPAKTVNLFDPADWRLKFFTNLQADLITPIPGGRLRRYNLKYTRVGAQLPDLYLMRAEAAARTGDLAGAVADVETLRQHRMPAAVAAVPAAIAADQKSLIKFIFDERIREFTMEGVRWFDMRRLSTDPLFAGQPAAQHTVYDNATEGTSYTLSPDRFTLKIPPAYLNQNPGMVDNP